jgi:uncharacterized protein (TIGR00375 family)
MVIADLHIHSRFSRATSSKLTPAYLDRWARIKGIQLLGTGDCTHPRWLGELREQLAEAGEGFYSLKEKVRLDFDRGPALTEGLPKPREAPVRFVLTGEISTIYKKGEKTRKVHHLVTLPDFKAAVAFQIKLERVGNISSDGRPILGIDSRDLLALLLEADERAILIPAHIWTPWFSALGAKSGFDSIEECYGDLSSFIPGVETGLSSNPPMNWALSSLDRYSIISNSDAHSPDKLGREATVFEMENSYASLSQALRLRDAGNGEKPGISYTVEFFPQEGKYHYDGHRKCGLYVSPEEAAASGGICPVCGKALTRGVMGRVMELADRQVDEKAAPEEFGPPDSGGLNRRPYRSLIPLRELLGEILKTGPSSKKVDAAYAGLIERGGSEFSLLMDMALENVEKLRCPGVSGELLAAALTRMRSGEVFITPGYDGEYGVIRVFSPGEKPGLQGNGLFEDMAPAVQGESDPPGSKQPGRLSSPGTRTGKGVKNGPLPKKERAPRDEKTFKKNFAPGPDQEKAAAYEGPRSIIIAGPGTGKTATLAARIGGLIAKGTDPASVLALSFTVKAAAELRERIVRFTGGGEANSGGGTKGEGVTVCTFHALCRAILREQAEAAGIIRDFRILSETERALVLRDLLDSSSPGKRRISPERLGKYIEGRKRFLLLPGETQPKLKGEAEKLSLLIRDLGLPPAEEEEERLYDLYRQRLRNIGAVDFEDLSAGTVRLLAGKGALLLSYRRRFRYIFVDEYQDINFAQYALIRLLAPAEEEIPPGENAPALWVIGDPNQAIYGFRGSDKRFIDRFTEDYPEAIRFQLGESFRCAGPIINAAVRLTDTPLTGRPGGARLFRSGYPTEKSEAEGIARTIAGLIGGASFFAIDSGALGDGEVINNDPDQGGITGGETGEAGTAAPEDCAVLLRTAALARPVIKALKDHGIPFKFIGEIPWQEEEPVKTALRLLREGDFSGKTKSPPEAVKSIWESLTTGEREPLFPKEENSPWERLLTLAAMYGDLSSFLDDLAVSGPGELPEIKQSGVNIMTIHASKGLEFDHVFIAALEEGILPFTVYDKQAKKKGKGPETEANVSNISVDEERRLLYVAMTRARKGLYLSWAESRNFKGRTLNGGPSRFLKTLEDIVPETKSPGRPRDSQMSLF